MIELSLAFFIFLTIFIDTLSISIKATKVKKRFAVVYVASQALTYLTRISLFFIMPVIGLILDDVLAFNIDLFLINLSILLLIHSCYYYFLYQNIVNKSHVLIYLFTKDLFKFYRFLLGKMLFGQVQRMPFTSVHYAYLFSHLALSILFPFVIYFGLLNSEHRGVMMGSIGVFSGVFSIYILFFIERKIPVLSGKERAGYIKRLVFNKILATFISAILLLVVLISG